MVTDNNPDTYWEIIDLVRKHKGSMSSISDDLREGFENQISKALDVLSQSEEVEPITIDLMREMLIGWGMSTFDRIARHYMDKD